MRAASTLRGLRPVRGDGVLGDDKPLEGAGALFEQALECAADVDFVGEVGCGAFRKRVVVFLDRGVGGLEFEVAHEVITTLTRGRDGG